LHRLVLILIACLFAFSMASDDDEALISECIHDHALGPLEEPILEEWIERSHAVVRVSLESVTYDSQFLDEENYQGYYGYIWMRLRVLEWLKGSGPDYIWVYAIAADACTSEDWTHEYALERVKELAAIQSEKIDALWFYAGWEAILLLYWPPTHSPDTYFYDRLWALGDPFARWRPLYDWITGGWIPWSPHGWSFWKQMPQGPDKIELYTLSEIRAMARGHQPALTTGAMLYRAGL